jgi:hypothetical protein
MHLGPVLCEHPWPTTSVGLLTVLSLVCCLVAGSVHQTLTSATVAARRCGLVSLDLLGVYDRARGCACQRTPGALGIES